MAFYRASIGGSGSGASWTKVEAVSQVASGSATFTIGQSLTVGNLYHIFTTNGGNAVANATTAAEITVSSGASNLTKIEEISGYFNSASYYSVIEHYTFVATSATVVFNKVATAKRLGYILYDTQGSGGSSRVQTGTYTSNTSSAVSINLDFAPSKVIVYQNLNTTSYAFVAISENQGAFSGWRMNGSTAASGAGTFAWSGNTFTHKAPSG